MVQNNSDSKIDDLAKGAGGGYRYLFCKADKEEPKKIVHAVLFRTSAGINSTPAGWDMMTADINKGRRKSRLYILLKTTDDQAKSVIPHASGSRQADHRMTKRACDKQNSPDACWHGRCFDDQEYDRRV